LYTDENYQDALKMFSKSSRTKDPIFTRATFWKGETEYVLNEFKEALLSFKQFIGASQASTTPEFKTVITILRIRILNKRI
jgi:TolA-binding protein